MAAQDEVDLARFEQGHQLLLAEKTVPDPEPDVVLDQGIVRDEDPGTFLLFPAPLRHAPGVLFRHESPRTEQVGGAGGVEHDDFRPAQIEAPGQIVEGAAALIGFEEGFAHRRQTFGTLHVAVVVARRVDQGDVRIGEAFDDPAHALELPRLSGAGQVAGADRQIGAGVQNVLHRPFEFGKVVLETAAEAVVEHSHPPFVEIGHPILGGTARVRVGKVDDLHEKRLTGPPSRREGPG